LRSGESRADDQRAQRRQFGTAAPQQATLDLLVASGKETIRECQREWPGQERTSEFWGHWESLQEPWELDWELG